MVAEGSQRRGRDGEDNAEEKAQKDWAKKAFEYLKSHSSAMGTRDLSPLPKDYLDGQILLICNGKASTKR